uniref:Uncharacterized protein n=1 Tax=Anguilla anguilla TaxID=7936 RepID=A0A0E9WZZ4_ANGAN
MMVYSKCRRYTYMYYSFFFNDFLFLNFNQYFRTPCIAPQQHPVLNIEFMFF